MQSNLIARETTYEMFIQKLAEGKTNGIDIAILAICELFDISIIVLFENYLWKSDEISLDENTCRPVDKITPRWKLNILNH